VNVAVWIVEQLVLTLAAVGVATLTPPSWRNPLAGMLIAAQGLAGVIAGVLVLGGSAGSLTIPTALPRVDLVLAPSPLGAFFLVLSSGVLVVAAVFGIGYAHGAAASRSGWSALAVFGAGMQLVAMAGDSVTFLLGWEFMAVASTVLVLAEHRERAEVRSAALWYAVMTHLSFVLLLLGFSLLAHLTGTTSFAGAGAAGSSWRLGVVVLLLLAGFATKAGLVPVHVWLPRAHPAAPSHVSALMSAAMVKMGLYGTLSVALILLPRGSVWWGTGVMVLGGVSALYGILQASVASDLKRLLAYSTTENMGLMFLAVGTGLLLRSAGADAAADVAYGAALLLAAAHAAFKTTLFLGAGAVVQATGERDLDRLGGLVSRMPWTSIAFGIGALGAASLPVTGGFVAEWALLQSLIHGGVPGNRVVQVAMPFAVAVVALTAGLALLTFVKAFGIAFLARPRSEGAAAAREVDSPLRAGLALGAVVVLATGVFPGLLTVAAVRASGPQGMTSGSLASIRLPQVGAVLNPFALSLLAATLAVPVLVIAALAARRAPRRRVELPWSCGGEWISPRMQYTATSYAEPLSRVFDEALRPERDIEITHSEESRYLVEAVRFRQQVGDVVESRVYRPLIGLMDRLGEAGRALQNGSIHRYLGYSFAALVIVLVVVAW
jgi:formate hydrogenlyase subunit 3/multisubunit Na+/H+ antiporter MnhD subunit